MVKKTKIKIRKARLKDVKQIHGLVNGYSRKGLMLARPVSYIETKIRDFFVFKFSASTFINDFYLRE